MKLTWVEWGSSDSGSCQPSQGGSGCRQQAVTAWWGRCSCGLAVTVITDSLLVDSVSFRVDRPTLAAKWQVEAVDLGGRCGLGFLIQVLGLLDLLLPGLKNRYDSFWEKSTFLVLQECQIQAILLIVLDVSCQSNTIVGQMNDSKHSFMQKESVLYIN